MARTDDVAHQPTHASFAMQMMTANLPKVKEAEHSPGHHPGTQEYRDQLHLDDIEKYGNYLNLSPGDVVPWRARQVNTSVPEQPFRFADLAPELRNRIAELVLYHTENEGVISSACHNSTDSDISTIVHVNGKWRTGRLVRSNFGGDLDSQAQNISHGIRERVRLEESSKLGPSDYDLTEAEQCSGLLQPYDFFFDGNIRAGIDMVYGHPALTRASRQLRKENLPLFYSTNEFRVMMRPLIRTSTAANTVGTLYTLGKKVQLCKKLPMAVNFWRAVGDTNLRNMKLFTLSLWKDCDLCVSNSSSGGAQLDIRRSMPDTGGHIAQLKGLNPADPYHHDRVRQLRSQIDSMDKDKVERKAQNLAFAQLIEEGGLCVQTIERALLSFGFKADWVAQLKYTPRVTLAEQAAMDVRWALMFPCW
ncbi:hypothetical protein LTR15_009014 [Elasticomyces elasticus]|nr:hypothetical protein LTR15_009014 [Elasticomyces elasticus]